MHIFFAKPLRKTERFYFEFFTFYLFFMQNHLPSSRTDLRVEKIGGDDSFQLRKTLAMLTERYENGGK